MQEERVDILLVEDNMYDAKLTVKALNKSNSNTVVQHVIDGAEAIDFLFSKNNFADNTLDNMPKLVLLDIKLPKVDGLEVLRVLKSHEDTKSIPIVMLTSSNQEKDIVTSYKLGANSYIVKPVDFDEFIESVSDIGTYWLDLNKFPV